MSDRAFIQVVVKGERETFPSFGLIDSGCRTTMMDTAIADAIGIDLSTCKLVGVGGIGGEGKKGYESSTTIYVPDFEYEFETPVVFMDLPTSIILGHRDFFLHFDILFQRKKEEFSLNIARSL